MRSIIHPLEVAWSWVERLVLAVIVLFTGTLVAVTFYQVFSRYALNSPLRWSEELSRYLFIWIVFLGAWAALKEGRHLGMDMLSMRLSPRWRARAGIALDAVMLGFLVAVLFIAPDILEITGRQRSAVLKIPMSYIYLAFPVAAALMSIEIVLSWLSPTRSTPGQTHLATTVLDLAAQGAGAAAPDGADAGGPPPGGADASGEAPGSAERDEGRNGRST